MVIKTAEEYRAKRDEKLEKLYKQKRIIIVELSDFEIKGLSDAIMMAMFHNLVAEKDAEKQDLFYYLHNKIIDSTSPVQQSYLRDEEFNKQYEKTHELMKKRNLFKEAVK